MSERRIALWRVTCENDNLLTKYDESWPNQIGDFTLKYSDPERAAELAKLTA